MPRFRRPNYPPYCDEDYSQKSLGITTPQEVDAWLKSSPETPDGRLSTGYNHWVSEERKRRVKLEAKRAEI